MTRALVILRDIQQSRIHAACRSALMKPKNSRASGDSWSFKSAAPWLILGTFAVFWFSFFALTTPLPGGPDVFVFRDAGCNWAGGNGLVAASVPHANTAHPLLFASYTPGALLLFGAVASVFGCSGLVDTFYNLAWATIAVLLLYRCFSLTSHQCNTAGLRSGAAGSGSRPRGSSRSTLIVRRCRHSACWWPYFCYGAARRLL